MSNISVIPRDLTDREAAIDAVLRFVIGLDDSDADLVRSAFTKDAVADLRPASVIGVELPELKGRDAIASGLLKTVGPLDTMHASSNFRVWIDDETAKLTCAVIAKHFPPGEGPSPKHAKSFTMGNRYTANLVRQDRTWLIAHITVACDWSEGDIGVLKSVS